MSRPEGTPSFTSPPSASRSNQNQPPGGPPMRAPAPVAQPAVRSPTPNATTPHSKTLPATYSSSSALKSPPTSATPPIMSSSLASFYGAPESESPTAAAAATGDAVSRKTPSPAPMQTRPPTAGSRQTSDVKSPAPMPGRLPTGGSSRSSAGPLSPTLDTNTTGSVDGPTSAASFYASLASQPSNSPKSSSPSTPSSHDSLPNAADQFLATANTTIGGVPSEPSNGGDVPTHRPMQSFDAEMMARPPSPIHVQPMTSILATIASKFDHPPINLAASSKRVLIKEGFLQRQARFKNVERYCYLFNDLFIVTEPVARPAGSVAAAAPAAAKLTMKQIVQLDQASMQPGKKPSIFIIDNAEKPLYFECDTVNEAREWIDAITEAIEESKSEGPRLGPKAYLLGEGETIFTAITKKDDQLLMYLLSERHDDPNELDTSGMTPLHRCVLNGFMLGVTLLLGFGADITTQTRDGKTALHLAGLNDEYAILLIFLSRKPDLNSSQWKDFDGRSPLWDLVQGPYKMHEKLVIERVEGEPSPPAPSPMSKKGRIKRPPPGSPCASPLTDEDDDDDDEDESDDDRPLSPAEKDLRSREAIQRNSWKNLVECVQLMIDAGCDLQSQDRSGRTLLMHLAATHSHESMKLIMEKGASLSYIDKNGSTVLHYAICHELSYGHVDDGDLADVIKTVQILLQAGVCPNLRDNSLNTPLHLCKCLAIAGCLIVHGARPDLKNDAGMKAIAYFESLQEKGAGADPNDSINAIKDAREQWSSRPDTFLPPGEDLEANSWLGDDLSDACLLCSERFTLTKRRHHCRRCGMLCCASCSTKKFTNPRRREEGLRSCDPCYNFMAHKYLKQARLERRALAKKRAEEQQMAEDRRQIAADQEASHQAFLRRTAEAEERNAAKAKRLEEIKANPDKPIPPPPAATKRSSTSSAASSSSTSSNTKSVGAKSDNVNAKAAQNVRLAQERGEKLSRMEDKAAAMEADAENFASMAAKLKEKQKNSWF